MRRPSKRERLCEQNARTFGWPPEFDPVRDNLDAENDCAKLSLGFRVTFQQEERPNSPDEEQFLIRPGPDEIHATRIVLLR
jgi:hypothetical protein